MSQHIAIDALEQLDRASAELAQRLRSGDVLYLIGDLGSGKTTFAQHLLRHLGVVGRVKSPTYTLYELHQSDLGPCYHMDLYRLMDPEELHYLGIDEVFNGRHLVLIEWPEKGAGVLPPPTHRLTFEFDGKTRSLHIA